MFDGLTGFFSHFQEKDWATFGFAMAAFIVSLWTAQRRHWFDRVKHLELQADFTAKWHFFTYTNKHILRLENVGPGAAYHVRAHGSPDPGHLLGLQETANGPLRTDEFFTLMSNMTKEQLEQGIVLESGTQKWDIVITWVDVYGERRRQIIKHDSVPLGDPIGIEGWNALHESPQKYQRGNIGSVEYQDMRTFPRMTKLRLRRVWVDRHGA